MEKKSRKVIYMLTALVLLTGCSKKQQDNTELVCNRTLAEIRQEAEDFHYVSDSIDCSEARVIIPDTEHIYDLSIDLRSRSSDVVKQEFLDNVRRLTGDNQVDMSKACYMVLEVSEADENGDREVSNIKVGMDAATDAQKADSNTCLVYNDGRYSQVLWQSSFMCELSDNALPTMLTGDETDYSDDWGYRALDLGKFVHTYYIPQDDISDVSYHLYDDYVRLTDAVQYVQEHIKTDYYFVGSELLDYTVYRVDVRELSDGVYYYQFYLKAGYDGISFNKDNSMGLEDNSDEHNNIFAESHLASMVESDTLAFIWSSCHSYEHIDLGKEHQSYISLADACRAIEQVVTDGRCFKIDSVELLYWTSFYYEVDFYTYTEGPAEVNCRPVYHFVIENPEISGYQSLYFDVDVETGEVIVTKGY